MFKLQHEKTETEPAALFGKTQTQENGKGKTFSFHTSFQARSLSLHDNPTGVTETSRHLSL